MEAIVEDVRDAGGRNPRRAGAVTGLEVTSPLSGELAVLPIAGRGQLYETMPVWTFGFPFGKDLAADRSRQLNPDNSGGPSSTARGVRICLYILGHVEPLMQLDPISVAPTSSDHSSYRRYLLTDKCYHLIPDAELLVIVPPARNRLILKHLNIDEALRKSGVDYLFVTSSPPGRVIRGRRLEHQISTKSKRGGVTYKLESGPEG